MKILDLRRRFLTFIVRSAKRDGAIGPNTLKMINRQSSKYLVDKLSDERQEFVENIRGGKDFERFGRGWTKRIEDVREQGLKLTSDS